MSIWAIRGLRDGVVTTKWPKKPDEYADTWRGPVVVRPGASSRPDVPPLPSEMGANTPTPEISGFGGRLAGRSQGLEGLCPTGAIESGADGVRVDQGKCILCGRCVAERPDLFGWSEGATGPRAAALTREALVVPEAPETDEAVEAARAALGRRTAALRRSVHVRHVDAGSDGSEEWEIQALLGPVYDIHRLGIFFTASPRHADILLVTGAGTPGMAASLREAYDGMPDPKVVVAAGADACSGGLLGQELTGIGGIVPVDIWTGGSPPSPFGIMNALLAATGRLT